MSLWVDKYRPRSLDSLDYHVEEAGTLKKLVTSGDFPHLLFYGPPGAGKKTRVSCLLRELYGGGVDKLRIEHHTFTTPSKKKINLDVGIYDRIVIQELIKDMASTAQLDITNQREFKVVVIHEVNRLSKDAQHSLRRTMEKYMKTCRLILCTESLSKACFHLITKMLCRSFLQLVLDASPFAWPLPLWRIL
uniref:Replication factor c subunit 3 n=1 Tax=Echinococcus granulosus TaxID=6210 RepID=A0A068W8H5_ECHGR|nr:replication factor c subunit 3 [Echinococcus granulosus]